MGLLLAAGPCNFIQCLQATQIAPLDFGHSNNGRLQNKAGGGVLCSHPCVPHRQCHTLMQLQGLLIPWQLQGNKQLMLHSQSQDILSTAIATA